MTYVITEPCKGVLDLDRSSVIKNLLKRMKEVFSAVLQFG